MVQSLSDIVTITFLAFLQKSDIATILTINFLPGHKETCDNYWIHCDHFFLVLRVVTSQYSLYRNLYMNLGGSVPYHDMRSARNRSLNPGSIRKSASFPRLSHFEFEFGNNIVAKRGERR